VAHEFGKFPHEVMALSVSEFDVLNAYLQLCEEEAEHARRA